MAAARVVLGLTIGVGCMAAIMGAGSDQLLVIVVLPTIVLVVALIRGAVPIAGWAGAAVWTVLLPSAHGEAVLAPLAMVALCLAIAIGPDRLTSWVGHDFAGLHDGDGRAPDGWIEEDGHPVD